MKWEEGTIIHRYYDHVNNLWIRVYRNGSIYTAGYMTDEGFVDIDHSKNIQALGILVQLSGYVWSW